jgi:YesN/AraC family two-component response regulator
MQKVLVVDDSKISRKKVIELLTSLGYDDIVEAVDGVDGMEKHASLNPELILSDIEMPNMTGLEMVKKIRESDKDVKIIIASSIVNASIIKEALTYHVQVLKKPLKAERFQHALELLNR